MNNQTSRKLYIETTDVGEQIR